MDINVYGPEWAHGCESCRHGLVAAPEASGLTSLFIERAIQARHGLLVFCDCRAGHMQRQHLRRVWEPFEQRTSNLHPSVVKAVVDAGNVGPTVRWVGEPQEAERVTA